MDKVIGPVEFASPSETNPALRLTQYNVHDTGAILEVQKYDGTKVAVVNGDGTIPGAAANLSGHTYRPEDYGTVGVDDTTDTALCQAAIDACRAAGRGTVLFEGVYGLNGPLALTPTGLQTQRIRVYAYNAQFRLKTATAKWLITPPPAGSPATWRDAVFEGIYCIVDSNLVTDAILFDGTAASNIHLANWILRDAVVEAGAASAPICNGINVKGNTNTIFEFALENPIVIMGANITGDGIRFQGGSVVSSARIINPKTSGCVSGIHWGSSGAPIQGGSIEGGTLLNTQQQLIKFYAQGGKIDSVHTETGWQTVPTGNLGGNIYVEGWAHIINQDDHRDSGGNALWAVSVFASGGATIIDGLGSGTSAAGPWLHVLSTDANRTGIVIVRGVPASQIDLSALTSTTGPYMDVDIPKLPAGDALGNVGSWSPSGGIYSNSINIDAGVSENWTIGIPAGAADGAWAINNPTNEMPGARLSITIYNNSGGSQTTPPTFGGHYHVTTALPANGKRKVFSFINVGTSASTAAWYCESVSPDLP